MNIELNLIYFSIKKSDLSGCVQNVQFGNPVVNHALLGVRILDGGVIVGYEITLKKNCSS